MFPTLAPVPILWTCQGQPFRAARRTLQAMASYGKLWQAMASYGLWHSCFHLVWMYWEVHR
jgi:hypothetical protein